MGMRSYAFAKRWLALSIAISKTTRVDCSKGSIGFIFSNLNSKTFHSCVIKTTIGSGTPGSRTVPFKVKSTSKSTTTSLKMTSTNSLIDVDCNLWHDDLKTLQTKKESDKDDSVDDGWNILREDAIEKSNIVAMLSPSSTIQEAEIGIDRLLKHTPPLTIKTTVGVHPYHVNDEELKVTSLDENEQMIRNILRSNLELCAAVGECGLDASDGFPPIQDQIPWFKMQVKIAQEMNLPLFVHERLAFEETKKILDGITVPIIIHCFTGTKEECIEYVKKGYYISVSGFILKENSDNSADVRACLEEGIVPLDKLMIETDAPYMGFTDCRKLYMEQNQDYAASLNAKKRKRLQNSIYPNVPSSLPLVLDKVVELYQKHDSSLTKDIIADFTTKNANEFFKFGLE